MSRHYRALDRLINHADTALRTLCATHPQRNRQSPAAAISEDSAEMHEKSHTAGLMRINHSGEVCAQALYSGQALTARNTSVRVQMEAAAAEEIDHLCWCEQRLEELDSQPSLLNPLWYAASFTIGASAGLLGDKWSLGFVMETEIQVELHLADHLDQLPSNDSKSRAIVEQMKIDEANHARMARKAGAAELPRAVKTLMRFSANIMKKIVYRV